MSKNIIIHQCIRIAKLYSRIPVTPTSFLKLSRLDAIQEKLFKLADNAS